MPGSFPIFDTVVRQFVHWMAPARALDLGPGAGKYGHTLAAAAQDCERVSVEVCADHVDRFGLRALYHRIDVEDMAVWWQHHERESFDLVVIGDSLQHLSKSDGLDLLNAMVYRCAWLVAVVPEFIVQDAADFAPHEVHRSVWSERDLHWHDLWAWDNARAMTLMVLRGYRPSSLTMDALVSQVNEGNLPLMDYDGQSTVRPCRLRLVDHGREVAYRPR